MARVKTDIGSALLTGAPFAYDDLARLSRIVMHRVRVIALGSHQVILRGMLPIWRTATREHAHTICEAQLLLDGTAECYTNGRWQSLVPGQVTLHYPGVPHIWRSSGKPFLRFTLWFSITPMPPMRLPEQWPYQPHTLAALQSLLEDVHSHTPGWSDRVVPHVTLLLSRLLALTEWPDAAVADVPDDTSLLHLLDGYLEDNLHNPISRRDIAGYLGISERTLTRQLNRLTGATLLERLESLRLTRACLLLTETDTPVEDISRFVGYGSPSYFCRRFRRQLGITPGQYREQATRAAGTEVHPHA